jgi:hypothetical protein
LGVEPEEDELAVVDEVCAAFFDAAEGGAEGGWHYEVACFGVGEAVFGLKGVDCVNTGV